MKRKITTILAVAALVVAAGCATVGGTLVGAGIGALAGDAEMGAAVGMTSGAVVDIFGRR
jgi:hypothetical protein